MGTSGGEVLTVLTKNRVVQHVYSEAAGGGRGVLTMIFVPDNGTQPAL